MKSTRTILALLLPLLLAVVMPSVGWAAGDGLLGQYYNQNNGANDPNTNPFTGTMVQRVDSQIDFDWGTGNPIAGINTDYFSVRWTGEIEFPQNGAYKLRTVSDDGVRLYIDLNRDGDFSDSGETLINNWNDHASTTNDASNFSINNIAVRYPVRLEFYERGGYAQMELYWNPPGSGNTFSLIPQTNFYSLTPLAISTLNFPCASNSIEVTYSRAVNSTTATNAGNYAISGGVTISNITLLNSTTVRLDVNALSNGTNYTVTVNNVTDSNGQTIPANTASSAVASVGSYRAGILGTYYDQNSVARNYFTGNSYPRIDTTINFDWGLNAPLTPVGSDDFSVQWNGYIRPTTTGSYTFYISGDDGIRLYIDGVLIVSYWSDHGDAEATSASITLTAGQYHRVTYEMYERGGYALARLRWSGPSISTQVVPAANLFHCMPSTTPVIEYQMDEAGWNGTANEVLNASSSSFKGTAIGLTTATAKVCRGASFPTTTPVSPVYISAPVSNAGASATYTDFSFGAWVQFAGSGDYTVLAGTRGSGGSLAHSLWLRRTSSTGWSVYLPQVQSSAIALTLPATASGTWYYIGLARRLASVTLHLYDTTGFLLGSATGALPGSTSITVDELRLGYNAYAASDWWLGSNGRQFLGLMDETRLYTSALTSTQFSVAAQISRTCSPVGPSAFSIVVGATAASTCAPRAITITALTSSGSPLTTYTGTVAITTSSLHGNWSKSAANGTLAPATDTDDNGAVSYTFAVADNGVAVLNLANTHADNLTVGVNDATNNISATSAELQFRSNGFVITPTAPSTSATPDVIAGRAQTFGVALWTQTNGNCAINTAYTGNKNLIVWRTNSSNQPVTAVSPAWGGVSVPAATTPAQIPAAPNLNGVAFNNGAATLILSASDVGQYALNLRDISGFAVDTNGTTPLPIDGSTSTFTVRPFGFNITAQSSGNVANPAANSAAGAKFVSAGTSFNITVAGVQYQSADDSDNDGFPDGHFDTDPTNNASLADNAVVTSFGSEPTSAVATVSASLKLPAAGVNTALAGTTSVTSFTNGSGVVNSRFDNVGIIELSADTSNYLGSGIALSGKSGYVGRFYPAYYTVAESVDPTLAHGHGTCSFTYQGEDAGFALQPVLTVTAMTAQNTVATNAGGAFWTLLPQSPATMVANLPASIANLPATATTTLSTSTSTLSYGTTTTDYDGRGTLTISNTRFSFNKTANPGAGDSAFSPKLKLTVNATVLTDTDGACYLASNTCSAYVIDGSDGSGFSGTELRYGRLLLTNVYGSSQVSALMPAQVQYLTTVGANAVFISNAQENTACSGVSLNTTSITLTDVSGLLSASSVLPEFDAGISSGGAGLIKLTVDSSLSATNATGMIRATVSVPLALRYNVMGSGLENPTATATFGVYGGRDPIFNLQEGFR